MLLSAFLLIFEMALLLFGQDEVLAVCKKMVVRVEDLMRWSCVQPSCWSSCTKAASCGTNGVHRPQQQEEENGSRSSSGRAERKKRCFQWQSRSDRRR